MIQKITSSFAGKRAIGGHPAAFFVACHHYPLYPSGRSWLHRHLSVGVIPATTIITFSWCHHQIRRPIHRHHIKLDVAHSAG